MGKRGVKIKPRGIDKITYNKTDIDLRDLEAVRVEKSDLL